MNMNLEIKAPEVSVPSIASGAMMVELSISVWTANKNDREAKKRLDAITGADESIHRVSKKLMGDHPLLDKIKKFAASTRTNLHYRYTLPWSDTGMRLLTTAAYFDYNKVMTEAQNEYEGMVAEFLSGYEWDVTEVISRSNGTLRRSEFPTVEQLRSKFGFRINYLPVPDAGDFRLDVSNEAQRVLADSYADFYQRKVEEAMNSVWERLIKAVTHVSRHSVDLLHSIILCRDPSGPLYGHRNTHTTTYA